MTLDVRLIKIRAGWYEAFGSDGWLYRVFREPEIGWILSRVNDPAMWFDLVPTLRVGREWIGDMPPWGAPPTPPPRNKGLGLLK